MLNSCRLRPAQFEARLANNIQAFSAFFSGKRILDLGANSGQFSRAAASAGAAHVTALEIRDIYQKIFWEKVSEDQLNPNLFDYKIGSYHDLPKLFHSQSFDIVMCFGVFYHLHNHIDFLLNLRELAPYLILETTVVSGEESALRWGWDLPEDPFGGLHLNTSKILRGVPTRRALREMLQYTGGEIKDWYDYATQPIPGNKESITKGQCVRAFVAWNSPF